MMRPTIVNNLLKQKFMDKKIEKLAVRYKEVAAEIAALESVLKPIEKELKQYAEDNRLEFDDDNQLKFENGVFIGVSTMRKLHGAKADLEQFAKYLHDRTGDAFFVTKINEKALAQAAADGNMEVLRLLDRHSKFVQLRNVETLKIYC